MRKIFFPAVLFVFCCSVSGAVSLRETNIALSSALDCTLSAAAAVTSYPAISLQGVSFEYDEDGIPWKVVFTRSDISSYSGALSFSGEGKRSWYDALLGQNGTYFSPLRKKAIDYLSSSAYCSGSLVLDGTITLDVKEAKNLELLYYDSSWADLVLPLSISLMISGSDVDSSLILEGDIEIIGGDDSKITVYSDNLSINGERISFSPFEIAY